MAETLEDKIIRLTGASHVINTHELQALWSNYGSIRRYEMDGGKHTHVIVKNVSLPDEDSHPRGWNTKLSHLRKVHSYKVETQWYREYSELCDHNNRVPQYFGSEQSDHETLILLEDLDDSGFPKRLEHATLEQMDTCLRWLAYFHARFMGYAPANLWPCGTYWHLNTRPDELEALEDKPLKEAAPKIDEVLTNCPFQTLVHGDAKLANFCFSENGLSVAAVDFQYVGGGCGMKDVAYFIGSCLSENDCERDTERLLNSYFHHLKRAMSYYSLDLDSEQIETSWRPLFAYAWADFHRFVKGWSPDHWKIHSFSERITKSVIEELSSQ